MSDRYAPVHYQQYLQLEQLLGAQQLRSEALEGKPAHDEMLFIIVHQVYELWFKQILHELSDVIARFDHDEVDERSLGTVVLRLQRVSEILKLLIQQIQVLETMTPLDFLDFRNYLFPASGFQSWQFRMVEVTLGLSSSKRITYGGKSYKEEFSPEQQAELDAIQERGSLFHRIEAWLERIPFLQFGDFKFLEHYQEAVNRMLDKEAHAIRQSPFLSDKEREMRLEMLGRTDSYYRSVMEETFHEEMRANGELRLSYQGFVAALLIHLYREEPILHLPFQLLNALVDIDEQLSTWRYRHAQMVLRMLGRKMGTGGSSGYGYLKQTAEKHHIFGDFFHVSTLLIPRSELPALPPEIRQELDFYFPHSNPH